MIYRQWLAESPSYLWKESPIFRDKYVFSNQRLILPCQGLSFPYPRLSLRGVRNSKVRESPSYKTMVLILPPFPLVGLFDLF